MKKMSAIDAAKWFIKNNYDSPRDSKSGNMKLQKMLYFSQLVHLAKFGEPLFDEQIYAFKNGSVVENVRQSYQHNNSALVKSAKESELELTPEQSFTFSAVEEIFGSLSANELSNLNHEHKSWKDAFELSKCGNGFYDKSLSIMTINQMQKNEVGLIQEMLLAYEESSEESEECIEVNGRKFYYNPEEITIDDNIADMLQSFNGPDSAYTISFDESVGVLIY